MKSPYVKPLFGMELFTALQSGARDCADFIPQENVTLNDAPACRWDLGGGSSVFVVGENCTIDGDSMGFVCYNNPGEGSYIFRS